ncbi:unnamed protein product [Musa hybrid cultivar]
MYASCDGLDLARQLFDEMPKKDRVSYNSLLDGYVKSCDFDEAERLLRIIPDWNVISWSTLFNGFVRNQMFSRGISFFQQMQELGVEPDDCSVVSLLVVYSNYELAQHGKSVHGLLLRRWRQIPLHVSNALVNFYCKCGLLDAAAKVFERTIEKDLISWNTLISGFGSNGRGEEALGFFKRMLQEGTKPNDITFIGILVACAHSGLVEEALHHFKMMSSEFGMKPTFAHHWCLVDLYVRLESPCDALKVIQEMPLYNQSAIWGAVICLAKVRGDISVGERLGKHLIELEPDNSRRYLPLLNIYTAASRWDKYKELMELMKARGLKKLPDCTLIDLNLVVHKFLVGDKSQPEIEKVYGVLENIANQLKLQPPKADDAMSTVLHCLGHLIQQQIQLEMSKCFGYWRTWSPGLLTQQPTKRRALQNNRELLSLAGVVIRGEVEEPRGGCTRALASPYHPPHQPGERRAEAHPLRLPLANSIMATAAVTAAVSLPSSKSSALDKTPSVSPVSLERISFQKASPKVPAADARKLVSVRAQVTTEAPAKVAKVSKKDDEGVVTNKFKPKDPYTGTCLLNTKITGDDAPGETWHMVFSTEGNPVSAYGQSIGVIPDGVDKNGKPHKLRLYSIASSALGDFGDSKTVSLCVKRLVYTND